MGAFVANFHVRASDSTAVRKQVADCGAQNYRVTDPRRGWITIYEMRASEQDEQWIKSLARELSSGLNTACVAFLLHESEIACYWLCDQGRLIDEFNSFPDYFEPVSAAERKRVSGQPDVFLRYCRPGVTNRQIHDILTASVTFADDTIVQLAALLDIDPERALQDFRDEGDDFGGGGWGGGDGDFGDDDDGWHGDGEDGGGPTTL
jgi:hypothetical protein